MADLPSATVDTFNNDLIVAGTTYLINLCTGDPGGTGANEDTSLTRQSITFAASSGGTQASSLAVSWTNVPGGKTYSYFVIYSSAATPAYIRGGILGTVAAPAPITPTAGSTVSAASGQISFVP